MRQLTLGLALTAITLLLDGCGGGSSSSSSSGGNQNIGPTANAGPPQTVTSGTTVTLNGSASSDPDGTIATYAWTQTAGSNATLSNVAIAQPTFLAPAVTSPTAFIFSLVVTDNRNAVSPASTVTITVNPAAATNVDVSGRIRFARAGFKAGSPFGLDYANASMMPARRIGVSAVTAGGATVLASTVTDDSGNYTLTGVPGNVDIQIQVVARLLRDASQPLPRWDVKVQNGTAAASPFTYVDPAVQIANAGTPRNVDVPLGIDAAGQISGTRASGPFAILDTIYTAIQGVLTVAPNTTFPPLIVDWGAQSDGTFFSSAPVQHIALLSDVTEDTDEFDQHVIAHEFGHYIEHNFSRADNIGGAHSLGNRLDPRVAFGEGFGYAFAAMMLGDPDSRDSFFGDITPNDGVDNPVQAAGRFNIEANPTGTSGCWCSESSVFSILYDLYDNAADSNDSVALGLQPLWNVLVNEQRTTPAFTTLFSFIAALKAAQPASAAAINTLVAAQNIDAASINAFASGETHSPGEVPTASALPLYTTTTIGAASLVLPTSNNAGTYNRLGNRRWVRFNVPSTRSVTITLATSNATDNDPDFQIFRAGAFVNSGEGPPPGPETNSFNLTAGDYLLDIYDCANGCSTDQGTAGNYNLTLTIN